MCYYHFPFSTSEHELESSLDSLSLESPVKQPYKPITSPTPEEDDNDDDVLHETTVSSCEAKEHGVQNQQDVTCGSKVNATLNISDDNQNLLQNITRYNNDV